MPKGPSPRKLQEFDDWLSAKGRKQLPSRSKNKPNGGEKGKRKPNLLDLEAKRLIITLAANPVIKNTIRHRGPNLGPNSTREYRFEMSVVNLHPEALQLAYWLVRSRLMFMDHTGREPQRFGLLDFQDIALFLWPPYRQHRGFDLEEQCHILKHRNPRLRDMTMEELVEVLEWMSNVEYITVEENDVDIREWRLLLNQEDLASLTRRMDEDLHRATSIISRGIEDRKIRRRRRLAAKRRIVDDDEDEDG